MSKIVQAINVMISNYTLIDKVIRGCSNSELFFLYNGKHKWSINKSYNDNRFFIHYYPGKQTIEEMSAWPVEAWENFNEIVTYSSDDLGTKEALHSLAELYTIIKEKIFAMDQAFDDIISDGYGSVIHKAPFQVKAPGARTAQLLGDFTEWDHPIYMNSLGDGVFQVQVPLKKGQRYEFKFKIDNEWKEKMDDGYETTPNPYGTKNYVIFTSDENLKKMKALLEQPVSKEIA